MRLKFKRIWSLVLCLCMVLSVLGGTSFAEFQGSGNDGANDFATIITNSNKVYANLKSTTGKPFPTAEHKEIHTVFTVQFAEAEEVSITDPELGTLYEKNGVHKYFESEEKALGEGYTQSVGLKPNGPWSAEYLVDMRDSIGHRDWGAEDFEGETIYLDFSERKQVLGNVLDYQLSGFKENVWWDVVNGKSFQRTFSAGKLLDLSEYEEMKFETGTNSDFIGDTGLKFLGSGTGNPNMYRVNMYQYWGISLCTPKDKITDGDLENLKKASSDIDEKVKELTGIFGKYGLDTAVNENDLSEDDKIAYAKFEQMVNEFEAKVEAVRAKTDGAFVLQGYATFYDAAAGGEGKRGNPPIVAQYLSENGGDDPHWISVESGRVPPIQHRLGLVDAGWDSFHNFQKIKSGPIKFSEPGRGGGDVPQWRLSKYFQEKPFKLHLKVTAPKDPERIVLGTYDELAEDAVNPPEGSWIDSLIEVFIGVNKPEVKQAGGSLAAYENPVDVDEERLKFSFDMEAGESDTRQIDCEQGYLPFKTNASHKVVTAQWMNGGISGLYIGAGYQSGTGAPESSTVSDTFTYSPRQNISKGELKYNEASWVTHTDTKSVTYTKPDGTKGTRSVRYRIYDNKFSVETIAPETDEYQADMNYSLAHYNPKPGGGTAASPISGSANGYYSESRSFASLTVVPEIFMLWDDRELHSPFGTQSTNKGIWVAGAEKRQIPALTYHTNKWRPNAAGHKSAITGSMVLDSKVKGLLNKLGLSKVNTFLKGSTVNVSSALSGTYEVKSYVLDIDNSAAKSAWGNGAYNAEQAHKILEHTNGN